MKYRNLSVSLPEPMADRVDQAAEKEHRTRSELVRQALRLYLDGVPVVEASPDEIAAMERGSREIRRGEHVTLKQLRHGMAPRRRQVGK